MGMSCLALSMKVIRLRFLLFAVIFWLLYAYSVHASRLLEGNPANYRRLLGQLGPGDTLQLRAGEYRQGLPVHNLNGRPDEPIHIAGQEKRPRPVFLGRPGANTVSIVDSSYVTIRNLVLDGRGMPVDGVKAEGYAKWAHHITLENLLIRGHGDNQQTVGISTKCPAWDWVISDNEIVGAGTGIYLGNSDGSDPFIAGLIEHNLIVDTLGYNLQVKHQRSRPDIAGIPAGENVTIIRHNVFSKADGGSEGPMARPNLLVGHWPLSGPGMDDRYLIYGNFFYQNPHEALFQGEGNIALYNNMFVNFHGDAIHIQPHNDVPRSIDVFYNTILATGSGVVIRHREGEPSPEQQTVQANIVFAETPISGGESRENISGPLEAAADYLERPFDSLGEMSLYSKTGVGQSDAIDTLRFQAFVDWDKDFDSRRRDKCSRGAGCGRGNWLPQLRRKPHPVKD